MHTFLKYFFSLSFFITCGISLSAQGISMSPTRLFFTGNPGETVSQPVILSNSSATDYVFNVNVKDWKREEDGNKIYFEPNTLPNSNALWISTLESSINLPAKSDKEIIVTMKIPLQASASQVTNSMLFFTQIGKQKDIAEHQKGIGIIALFEFGLHIYFTPAQNTNQSLDITSIQEVFEDGIDTRKVLVGIENDGNVVNDATVELELTNTSSGAEIKLDPINISMIPGAKQVVSFQLPKDIKGTFLGVSIIKMAGTNDLRVGEKTFEF